MKHIQLAKIYKGGTFFGYALAVDGELLAQQESTTISTNANELPRLYAQFHLNEQQAENPIIIHIDQVEPTPL